MATGWEHAVPDAPFQLPPVHLDYTPAGVEALLRQHILGAHVLGADVEWRPTGAFFNGDGRPALLQLATPAAVVLVPLAHLPEWPPALQRLMQAQGPQCPPGPIMCGVGVHEDLCKVAALLREASGTTASGLVDTEQAAASDFPPAAGVLGFDVIAAGQRAGVLPRGGLAAVVATMGGPQLRKPKKVQMSDWARRNLSAAQIEYAALDAYAGGWVAARIHAAALEHAQQQSNPSPQPLTQPLPPPPPPLIVDWMAAEIEVQRAERAAVDAQRAARLAALESAALRAVSGSSGGGGGGDGWVDRREVVAAMQAAVPGARDKLVLKVLSGLVERGVVRQVEHEGGCHRLMLP